MSDSNFSPIDLFSSRPKIVIVGRPNVGKSTLFNRLFGRRRSITDAMPGVTRDPVEEACVVADIPVVLIDTGGFKLERDRMDDMVTGRIFKVLEHAALILFVIDIMEFTLEDEEFRDRLRPYGEKVLLVANKMDHQVRDNLLWNHHSLGFPDVVGISAAHGRNIDDLEKAIKERLSLLGAVRDESEEETSVAGDLVSGQAGQNTIRIAILGKPNTGKSTLLNALSGRDISLVSDIPGTTRDVIGGDFSFKGRAFHILDTAGIRRKNRVNADVEYYSVHRAFGALEHADVVYLLSDASEEVSDQDKKIAEQAVKRGKGVIIALNKWDLRIKAAAAAMAPKDGAALKDGAAKFKPLREEDLFRSTKDRVRFLFPILGFAPILPISALEKTGIDKLLNTTVSIYSQLHRSIDTPKLNTLLKKWAEEYNPPRDRGIQYKPRYMTQVSVNPVKFLLFVNRKKGFPEGWVQFLKNRLRKEGGFDLIPFSVDLKQT